MKGYKNKELEQISRMKLEIPYLNDSLEQMDKNPNRAYQTLEKNMYMLQYRKGTIPLSDRNNPLEISIFPRSIVLKDYFPLSNLPNSKELYICYLLHECYHLKDLRKNGDIIEIGFTKIKDGIYFNLGLNEGCTQFLVSRDLGIDTCYVDKDNSDRNYYLKTNAEVAIFASMMSDMIGEEKLRELQEKHDVVSLYQELGSDKMPLYVEKLMKLLDQIKRESRIDDIKMGIECILEIGKEKDRQIQEKIEEKAKILTMRKR